MGTILELPLWRAQRPPPVGPGQEAQIIIFSGVRVERQDVGPQRAADSADPSPRDGRTSRLRKP
jgi:hypothetical protein